MQRSSNPPQDPHDDHSTRSLYPHHFAASVLDLDEHSRLSLQSSNTFREDDELSASDNDDPDVSLPRMSLGPKMRFHSRAPWELESGGLHEEDDQEYTPPFPTSKKAFTFSITKSIESGRVSGESSRSQAKSKRSFETTSSQLSYPRGALYALAQESLSTSSLVSSTGQYVSPPKFSLNRFRSGSPRNLNSPGSHSPADAHFTKSSPRHNNNPPDYPSTHRRPTYNADDFHPYANPDLVTPYAPTQSHSLREPEVLRSASTTTVTDSDASIFISPSPKLMVVTPASVRSSISAAKRKPISPPVSTPKNTLRSDEIYPRMDKAVGATTRTDRDITASFTLISLEEARAQRSRSGLANAAEYGPLDHSLAVPDARGESGAETEYIGIPLRTRGRSISTGPKSRNALQSIVGASIGPPKLDAQLSAGVNPISGGASGKVLKHKKSGFMRLFNGRAAERGEKDPAPPIPTLSNEYTAHSGVSRTTTHIPVPKPLPLGAFQDESIAHFTNPRKSSPSPRRPIPPLSIDTHSRALANRGPISAIGDICSWARAESSDLSEGQNEPFPQSAPANVPDFPTLRLRPVSTVFSAHFTEHMMTRESVSSNDTEFDTPASLSVAKVFSPITPSSITHSEVSNAAKPPPWTPEDQSSCHPLEEQISTELANQRHRSELEGRVKELERQLEELRIVRRIDGYCNVCGRGSPFPDSRHQHPQDAVKEKVINIMHRPRARTATSSRFGDAIP